MKDVKEYSVNWDSGHTGTVIANV